MADMNIKSVRICTLCTNRIVDMKNYRNLKHETCRPYIGIFGELCVPFSGFLCKFCANKLNRLVKVDLDLKTKMDILRNNRETLFSELSQLKGVKREESDEMPQFTFTNRLMEKALRRAFLDGVMEIYESSNQPRVYSITLEGTLSLFINKTEKFYIKLQETAERAKEPDHKLVPKTAFMKLAESGSKRDTPNDCIVGTNCRVTMKTEKVPISNLATISTTKTPIMTFQCKPLQRIAPKPITTTVTVVSPKVSSNDSNTSISYTVSNNEEFSLDKVKKEPNTSGQVSSTEVSDIKIEPIEDEEAVTSTNDRLPGTEVMVVQPEWIVEESDQGLKRDREDEDESASSSSDDPQNKKAKVTLKNPIMAINIGPSQKDMLYYHKNIVECPLCKEPINNQTFLLLHLEKHRKDLAEECDDCKQEGRPIDALLYHLTNFHTPDGQRETEFQKIKAPTLNAVENFSNESKIDASKMVKFMLEKNQATEGPSKSVNHGMSIKHEVMEIPKSGPEFQIEYVCDLCGGSYSSNKELTLHYQAEHGNSSGSYTCPSCPACFDDVFKFQDHLLEHHKEEEKCVCQHCDTKFDKWKDLKHHLLTVHRKFFVCPQCKASFTDEDSLKEHIEMHESERPDSYECDMCDKSFHSTKTYNAHRRSHIDVKPYVCPICQSAFFKRGDMAKHMRTIHEPTKLYMCKICGRTGTRADNMRVHVRTHKKEISREQVDQLLQKVDQ